MENPVMRIDVEKRIHTSQGPITLTVNTVLHGGELVALFGPSGAGKTTLLRILAGLTNPDRGVVCFGSKIWFDSSRRINLSPQKREISFMFQDYALFPNMTVEQNIQYAMERRDIAKVDELLSVFGLSEFKARKTTGLSGGQRQRVALARALAREPRLLLLDEPLSAVDGATRIALQDEIARAHSISGASTLMVSHDLHEVFRLANRVLQIDNGTIRKQGSPEFVFSDQSLEGQVQITGQVACIEKQDTVYIVTVISGTNQVIKVVAFESDLHTMQPGDKVLVFSKASNPVIQKLRA